MQNDNARTRQDADLVSDAIAAPAYPCPTDDCDLYAEDALLNPYPNYARLRDKGVSSSLSGTAYMRCRGTRRFGRPFKTGRSFPRQAA